MGYLVTTSGLLALLSACARQAEPPARAEPPAAPARPAAPPARSAAPDVPAPVRSAAPAEGAAADPPADCGGLLSSESGGKRRPRAGTAAVGYEVDGDFVPVLQFNDERAARRCAKEGMVTAVWSKGGWTVR
jgi:hypothetical protein